MAHLRERYCAFLEQDASLVSLSPASFVEVALGRGGARLLESSLVESIIADSLLPRLEWSAGRDINVRDSRGRHLLHTLIGEGQYGTARRLLRRWRHVLGDGINAVHAKKTPFALAVKLASGDDLDASELALCLFEAGADANIRAPSGFPTALQAVSAMEEALGGRQGAGEEDTTWTPWMVTAGGRVCLRERPVQGLGRVVSLERLAWRVVAAVAVLALLGRLLRRT